MRSPLVDIEVQLVHQTDGAWLVRSSDTGEEAWVPKSVGEMEGQGILKTLTLPQNMAEEKRLV